MGRGQFPPDPKDTENLQPGTSQCLEPEGGTLKLPKQEMCLQEWLGLGLEVGGSLMLCYGCIMAPDSWAHELGEAGTPHGKCEWSTGP